MFMFHCAIVVMVIILLLPSSKIMIAEGKELAKEYVIQMDDKEPYYQRKEKFDIIKFRRVS